MSEYNTLIKRKNKALKVFHNAIEELVGVTKSIEMLRDANAVAMQDAKAEIEARKDFIEKKATANSMLQQDLDQTQEQISKIKDIINVR